MGPERLIRLEVGEPAGCLEQAVVIGAAAGTPLEVDRRAGIHPCRVFPSELELDGGVEDLLAGGAARISVQRAQKFVEATKIGPQAASSSSTGCPAAAMLARRLRLASNRFL
jgi:hypothetical protein